MKKLIIFASAFLPIIAFGADDLIKGKDTTPLKVLCKAPGYAAQILVQFVKDNQAEPGVYVVQRGQFWPANKITKVSYELYGESMSKVGRLDNGGKVRLYFTVSGVDLVGTLEKSDATFGDDTTLTDCQDLMLK